jgi:hypothetical protein
MAASKVFQVVVVNLAYNTEFFFASCCCSFLLHVVANLICIFLVSDQLVLLSKFQTLFVPFVAQSVYRAVLLKKNRLDISFCSPKCILPVLPIS